MDFQDVCCNFLDSEIQFKIKNEPKLSLLTFNIQVSTSGKYLLQTEYYYYFLAETNVL